MMPPATFRFNEPANERTKTTKITIDVQACQVFGTNPRPRRRRVNQGSPVSRLLDAPPVRWASPWVIALLIVIIIALFIYAVTLARQVFSMSFD